MRATTAPGLTASPSSSVDAQQPPRRRRGDDEAVAHARLALLVDRHAQRGRARTGATSTGDRRRAQEQQTQRRAAHARAGRAERARRARACAVDVRPSIASRVHLPRLQHRDQVEAVEAPAHEQRRGAAPPRSRHETAKVGARPITTSGMRNSSHWYGAADPRAELVADREADRDGERGQHRLLAEQQHRHLARA